MDAIRRQVTMKSTGSLISTVPTLGEVITTVKKALEVVIHIFIIYNKNRPTNSRQWYKMSKRGNLDMWKTYFVR